MPRPLDDGPLSLGRVRAPVREPVATPLPLLFSLLGYVCGEEREGRGRNELGFQAQRHGRCFYSERNARTAVGCRSTTQNASGRNRTRPRLRRGCGGVRRERPPWAGFCCWATTARNARVCFSPKCTVKFTNCFIIFRIKNFYYILSSLNLCQNLNKRDNFSESR